MARLLHSDTDPISYVISKFTFTQVHCVHIITNSQVEFYLLVCGAISCRYGLHTLNLNYKPQFSFLWHSLTPINPTHRENCRLRMHSNLLYMDWYVVHTLAVVTSQMTSPLTAAMMIPKEFRTPSTLARRPFSARAPVG